VKAEINEVGDLIIHAEQDSEVGALRSFFNNEMVRRGGLHERIGFRVDPPMFSINERYSAALCIYPDPGSLGHVTDRRFVLVTERDTSDVFTNGGAICGEQYMSRANLCHVVEHAENLGNRYGRVGIFALVEIGTIEDCKRLLQKE